MPFLRICNKLNHIKIQIDDLLLLLMKLEDRIYTAKGGFSFYLSFLCTKSLAVIPQSAEQRGFLIITMQLSSAPSLSAYGCSKPSVIKILSRLLQSGQNQLNMNLTFLQLQ